MRPGPEEVDEDSLQNRHLLLGIPRGPTCQFCETPSGRIEERRVSSTAVTLPMEALELTIGSNIVTTFVKSRTVYVASCTLLKGTMVKRFTIWYDILPRTISILLGTNE